MDGTTSAWFQVAEFRQRRQPRQLMHGCQIAEAALTVYPEQECPALPVEDPAPCRCSTTSSPPLSQRRPWESLHAAWASALADLLNEQLLPPGYVVLETDSRRRRRGDRCRDLRGIGRVARARIPNGGTATATRTVWVPGVAPLVIPACFLLSCTVQILATDGGRTLVDAIELVSPGNKDRASKRGSSPPSVPPTWPAAWGLCCRRGDEPVGEHAQRGPTC